jgi:hypothetical protein
MITDDIEIAKEIFDLLDSGIVNEYDSFKFTVHLHDNYMEEELLVTSKGIESSNVETNFNGAILYSLVERLKQGSLSRGGDWKSFVMSYVRGGEVKIKFDYP